MINTVSKDISNIALIFILSVLKYSSKYSIQILSYKAYT